MCFFSCLISSLRGSGRGIRWECFCREVLEVRQPVMRVTVAGIVSRGAMCHFCSLLYPKHVSVHEQESRGILGSGHVSAGTGRRKPKTLCRRRCPLGTRIAARSRPVILWPVTVLQRERYGTTAYLGSLRSRHSQIRNVSFFPPLYFLLFELP